MRAHPIFTDVNEYSSARPLRERKRPECAEQKHANLTRTLPRASVAIAAGTFERTHADRLMVHPLMGGTLADTPRHARVDLPEVTFDRSQLSGVQHLGDLAVDKACNLLIPLAVARVIGPIATYRCPQRDEPCRMALDDLVHFSRQGATRPCAGQQRDDGGNRRGDQNAPDPGHAIVKPTVPIACPSRPIG
jgi:hypothetical protein